MPSYTEIRKAYSDFMGRAPSTERLKYYAKLDKWVLFRNIAGSVRKRELALRAKLKAWASFRY